MALNRYGAILLLVCLSVELAASQRGERGRRPPPPGDRSDRGRGRGLGLNIKDAIKGDCPIAGQRKNRDGECSCPFNIPVNEEGTACQGFEALGRVGDRVRGLLGNRGRPCEIRGQRMDANGECVCPGNRVLNDEGTRCVKPDSSEAPEEEEPSDPQAPEEEPEAPEAPQEPEQPPQTRS